MGVNDDQLTTLMQVIKKNPGLFQKMGEEIEELVGKKKIGYQEAALAIAQKYQKDLSRILG